jgi:hypothetical protein
VPADGRCQGRSGETARCCPQQVTEEVVYTAHTHDDEDRGLGKLKLELAAIYISVFSAVLACASLYLSHFRRPKIEVTFGQNVHLYHPENGGTGIYVSVVIFNTSPTLGTVNQIYLRIQSPDGFDYLLRWLEEWTITSRESDYEFLTVARPFSVEGHSSRAKFLWFNAPDDDEPLMFVPGKYKLSLLLESNATGQKEEVCEETFLVTDFVADELARRYRSNSAKTRILPFEGKTQISAKVLSKS